MLPLACNKKKLKNDGREKIKGILNPFCTLNEMENEKCTKYEFNKKLSFKLCGVIWMPDIYLLNLDGDDDGECRKSPLVGSPDISRGWSSY